MIWLTIEQAWLDFGSLVTPNYARDWERTWTEHTHIVNLVAFIVEGGAKCQVQLDEEREPRRGAGCGPGMPLGSAIKPKDA